MGNGGHRPPLQGKGPGISWRAINCAVLSLHCASNERGWADVAAQRRGGSATAFTRVAARYLAGAAAPALAGCATALYMKGPGARKEPNPKRSGSCHSPCTLLRAGSGTSSKGQALVPRVRDSRSLT